MARILVAGQQFIHGTKHLLGQAVLLRHAKSPGHPCVGDVVVEHVLEALRNQCGVFLVKLEFRN